VRQDVLLEALKLRAGLETELLHEVAASISVCVERVRLAPRAVEGKHQLRPEALTERMTSDECAELAHQLAVTTCAEVRVDPRFVRLEARLLEPGARVERKTLAGEIGKRLAPPQIEGGSQNPGGVFEAPLREQRPALVSETLEPRQVELLPTNGHHVSGRARPEHVMWLKQFSQPGDVLLERRRSVVRGIVAPELLDKTIGRDDVARLEKQEGEDAPLLDAPEAKLPIALPDLERTKDAEVEERCQGVTVSRRSGT
jgi:hypothetical protein